MKGFAFTKRFFVLFFFKVKLGTFMQGTGSDVESLGLVPAPVREASVPGSSLTCYAIKPAPRIHSEITDGIIWS